MRKLFVLPLILVSLTGCFSVSPYSSEFSCPGYKPGVCGSIEDVYRMYKQGKFSRDGSQKKVDFTYAPKKCEKKLVCQGKDCKEITICEPTPDTISNHIDYRAQAVKDNEYNGEIIWQ